MKTDQLITLLAHDTMPRRPVGVVLTGALAAAIALAALSFAVAVGPRPDFAEAVHSPRFLFKFVITVCLALTAVITLRRLARPTETLGRKGLILLAAPALMTLAALVEMSVMPEHAWLPRLIGHNARFCLTLIPFLSVGPLILLLLGLRQAAPANPGLTGAIAGLAASGIAATFYAANCTDDSPLFVITWYPIAFALVAIAGFLLGRKLLRW